MSGLAIWDKAAEGLSLALNPELNFSALNPLSEILSHSRPSTFSECRQSGRGVVESTPLMNRIMRHTGTQDILVSKSSEDADLASGANAAG